MAMSTSTALTKPCRRSTSDTLRLTLVRVSAVFILIHPIVTEDARGRKSRKGAQSGGKRSDAAGFSLTRTGPTTFIGSLFWLAPGGSYDVRVRFSDPDD